MNIYYRRILQQFKGAHELIVKKSEEATVKAAAIHLHFPVKASVNKSGTKVYPFYGKAMPDVNKHIDFLKFRHINPAQVRAFGILNVGASLSSRTATGEITLVYRKPGTENEFVEIPRLNVAIKLPQGLKSGNDFGTEGTAYFDIGMVPVGATLLIQVKTNSVSTVKATGADLRIEFRPDNGSA